MAAKLTQIVLTMLQVPVLETPDGAIRESNAICRYLASLGSSGLYPAALSPTADVRGKIDAWIDWSMGNLAAAPGACRILRVLQRAVQHACYTRCLDTIQSNSDTLQCSCSRGWLSLHAHQR